MSRNISHYEILYKLGAGGMGEVYLTGLNNLDHFAWIGAFSSGGFPEDFNASFPALDAKANQLLHLLWIACGTEDRLIDANRKFRGWLKSKGIRLTEIETPGQHTWMVWRRNLAEFASLLFWDKAHQVTKQTLQLAPNIGPAQPRDSFGKSVYSHGSSILPSTSQMNLSPKRLQSYLLPPFIPSKRPLPLK